MKTIKPLRLSVLNRPYRHAGSNHLCVAALGLIGLESEPKLYSEQDLWRMASEELGAGTVLDLCMPKKTPEWLLSGYAYTAHQDDKTTSAVQVRVGGLSKSLIVSGDRFGLDGRITKPQPYERMPLGWPRAYGGARVAENPVGLGTEEHVVNGIRTRRIPNVEAPHQRVHRPGDSVQPASFDAMGPDWPCRLRLLGNDYGQQWRDNDFPGLARDADWSYFNSALPDQRWEGRQEAPAQLPYELWNVHPKNAVVRGQLPDWRVRAFASRRSDASELEEASMRLDTVWFFPHLERAVLIWHGNIAIREDDAADVHHLMAAIELRDESRSMEHYEAVLQKRLNPATAIYAVRDSDLAPRSILGRLEVDEKLRVGQRPAVRNALAGARRHHEQRRQELARRGVDPDAHLPPFAEVQELPELDDLPLYKERLDQMMTGMRNEGGKADRHETPGRESGSRRSRADPEVDFSAAVPPHAMSAQPGGPDDGPRVDPEASIERLRRRRKAASDVQAGGADAQAQAIDDAREEQQIREAHRRIAHLQPAPPQASTFRSAKWRRRLERARAQSRSFPNANLCGVDLSGMDLREYDFANANLEGAKLRGTRLDGTNLKGAVLVRVDLTDASLAKAVLDDASLAKATCLRTDFTGASLQGTNCQGTAFESSVFSGATFKTCEMRDSQWHGCDLSHSRWSNVLFWRNTLSQLRFVEADFKQVSWVETVLEDVSFSRAQFLTCSFVKADGHVAVDFRATRLEACSFAYESNMAGALFSHAVLRQCGLRTTRLEGADFAQARLSGCDLSECDLTRANLDGVNANESTFIRTRLYGASLRAADLMDACLGKADLRFADLARANLFRADVSQALIDSTTSLTGAYTQHAKLWPKLQVEGRS